MIKSGLKWSLTIIFCLDLWTGSISAADEKWLSPLEESDWQTFMEGGLSAYQRAEYVTTAEQFREAVELAEKFGSLDQRLAESLTL